MTKTKAVLGSVTAMLLLSSCSGGPQFTGLFNKITLASPAGEKISEARSATPTGSDYAMALYNAELDYANFEFDEMNDYGSAIFHGEQALAAASGNPSPPQSVGERMLSESAASELSSARERLVAQLDTDKTERMPEAAADAHASFNCWLEQQEENLQPSDIAQCRDRFLASIETLEQAPEPEPEVAADKTARAEPDFRIAGDGLFNFDEATITESFGDQLNAIADEIKSSAPNAIAIVAHTDSVGSDEYNQELSEKRAASVADYLIGQGIDGAIVEATGVGEAQPIDTNDTAVGRSLNRRAEIFLKY